MPELYAHFSITGGYTAKIEVDDPKDIDAVKAAAWNSFNEASDGDMKNVEAELSLVTDKDGNEVYVDGYSIL